MKNVLFLANDQDFENYWKINLYMFLAWCYIYVWLLIYYVSVFICSSTDIWCKTFMQLSSLWPFEYIYHNILEYIGIYSPLRRIVKKLYLAPKELRNLWRRDTCHVGTLSLGYWGVPWRQVLLYNHSKFVLCNRNVKWFTVLSHGQQDVIINMNM